MRIVAISDTHNRHDELILPDGDVLIHSGDATIQGTSPEIHEFAMWWNKQKYKYKVFVPGNHDWGFQIRRQLSSTLIANLVDEGREIEGLKVWGAPWQPNYYDWAFNLARGKDIAAHWDLIPEDTDILVTHGPPHGILDENSSGLCSGCYDLRSKVAQIKPKLHIFGHIHEGYGEIRLDGTHFVNASACDRTYRIKNDPVVIDL